MRTLTPDDGRAAALVQAIRAGDLDRLARLLEEDRSLACAWIRDRKRSSRSTLHHATDWPGYFPNGPEVVRLLVDAGADPTRRSAATGRRRSTGRPAATTSTSPTR